MRFSRYFYSFMFCVLFCESASGSEEEQFVCDLRSEVVVADHLALVPLAKIRAVNNKYVFIIKGNKGTYINLSGGSSGKGILAVHSDGLKITLVEQNTSDNLFVATIFRNAQGGFHELILSFHSESGKVEHYYPKQLYGSCN